MRAISHDFGALDETVIHWKWVITMFGGHNSRAKVVETFQPHAPSRCPSYRSWPCCAGQDLLPVVQMDDSYPFASPPPTRAMHSEGAAGYRESQGGAWAGHSGSAPATEPVTREDFEFTGNASDYFRIWIVNVALTIATFGIYSAWAKVRTRKYMMGHTRVAGGTFDYHADPIRVLKGRLILVAGLAALGLAQSYSPILYLVLVMVVATLSPWLVVQALKFNARNTSYRNVRFGFIGQVSTAYLYFLVYSILVPITAGFFWPTAKRDRTKWLVTGHTWGDRHFEFDGNRGPYWRPWLMMAGGIVAFYAMVGVGIFALGGLARQSSAGSPPILDHQAMIGLLAIIVYPLVFFVIAHVQALLTNIMWSQTSLDAHRFESRISGSRLFWLMLSGLVAAVASFGLLAPWAKIRLARYHASCLSVLASGDLVAHRDTMAGQGGAMADAALDFGELDLDFGL